MSHQSLINSLTLFYRTLSALHYIDASEVILPPEQGHHASIDEAAAHAAGFTANAIALIQRLPYLSQDITENAILPDGTKPLTYLEEDNLHGMRRATCQENPDIKPHQVLLSSPQIYGTAVVYDTQLQRVIPWEPFNPAAPVSLVTDDYAILSHLPWYMPDELITNQWTQNLLSLTWLPYLGDGGNELITTPLLSELLEVQGDAERLPLYQLRLIQLTLRESYIDAGWKVSSETLEEAKAEFEDTEAWEERREGWKERVQGVLDQAYTEDWTWSMVRKAIGGELMESELVASLDEAWPVGKRARHLEL